MNEPSLYRKADIPDPKFPVRLVRHQSGSFGPLFENHWHEQMEILYFIQGNAAVTCGAGSFDVEPGNLVVVNSNELHCGQNCGDLLVYFCLDIDTSLLQSSCLDTCGMKYITPIERNTITFNNKITDDPSLAECMSSIISENENKDIGYELVIKSNIYKLLALLIRKHVSRVISPEEYKARVEMLERLGVVLKYIEGNYTERISTDKLCRMAGLSISHFCRLFKKVTGRTVNEYVNICRVNKAEALLKQTGMNVTEAALATGFDDANYFSRIFRKYKKEPPSAIKRKLQ